MFLRKKIQASSLAEVVITIAVIAICFGVASLVFVRATMVSANFQNVRHQTEIQSMLWEQLHTNSSPIEIDGVQRIEENDELEDALMVYTYIGTDNKVIWKQQWLKDD